MTRAMKKFTRLVDQQRFYKYYLVSWIITLILMFLVPWGAFDTLSISMYILLAFLIIWHVLLFIANSLITPFLPEVVIPKVENFLKEYKEFESVLREMIIKAKSEDDGRSLYFKFNLIRDFTQRIIALQKELDKTAKNLEEVVK